MKEDAITTFDRRLRILAMFRGSEPLTAPMIYERLQNTGEVMDERSVQRALDLLGEAGYLEKLNPGSKPLRWRWPKSRKYLTLPRLADQEILAFRLLELFLRPLLPPEAYQALRPYFEAAQNELNKLLSWAPVKAWESKVRVIPPAQPLLPPELPLPLAAAADPQQWRTHQAAVRDAVLKALFENQFSMAIRIMFSAVNVKISKFLGSLVIKLGKPPALPGRQ